jgi:hypothetical protein
MLQENQAYQQQLQNYYASQQPAKAPAYQQHLDAATTQGYVTADQMSPLVEQFQSQFTAMESRNNELLNALHLVNEQRKADAGRFSPLLQESANTRLNGSITAAAKRLGVSDSAMDFFTSHSKNLHAAYEGDDLNDQFPGMIDDSWKQMLAATSAHNKAEAAQAKRGIVGGGGRTSPSMPLTADLVDPDDIADEFFTDETDE